MRNLIAFADESGNNSFDFATQGTHFIVASIIVSKETQKNVEDQIEFIRKKYFQNGEMKSTKVAGNDQRRLAILREIAKVDFIIYAVVVDKQKLFGEGFKYKKSFYKFLNGLVYNELFKTFPELNLVVDEHGSNDFMRQFKKYVYKNHIPDLFSGSEFNFQGSPDSILIQLADFIAGTLMRIFDETKYSSNSKEFIEILKPKISSINLYPPTKQDYSITINDSDLQFNPKIAEIGVNSARHYIDITKGDSQDNIDRINCVKLLLLYFNTYGNRTYIPTKELIRHIETGRGDKIKEHYFRTKIIGKIRDEGVLVVSSSAGEKKGYKLPSSTEDLYKYVNHGKSVILPMLSRIKKFRDKIKLATQNEIDILDKDNFEALRKLMIEE